MRLRNPFGRKPKEFPSHLWTQCPNCGEMLFNKQLDKVDRVCPSCGHHFRLSARSRLAACCASVWLRKRRRTSGRSKKCAYRSTIFE